MQLKKGTEIEVTIQHMNISGRGIGFYEDYNVAVNGLFPGDKATVSITKIKKKYLEARLIELLEPSSMRIEPRSKHAAYNGGSPWECIAYDQQLKFKQNEVERIMSNINVTADIEPIIGMNEPWFYRNKMQFSFGYDADMSPTLGLHVAGRKYDVYDLEEEFLSEPWMGELVCYFREKTIAQGLIPYRFKTGEGHLRDLTVRVGKRTNQAMVVLSISEQMDFEQAKEILLQAAKDLPHITSFWIEVVTVMTGRRTSRELTHIAGTEEIDELLTVNSQDLSFRIGPTSFFQPNTDQAEVIYNQVAQLADLTGEEIVYDLFCGTGTIGLSLAPQSKHVYGIDIVEESIQKASINMQNNNISNATYIAADIFKHELTWPQPDLVVFDPPRAGLSPKLVEFITGLKPKKIIYVSCNLKSFAHDLQDFQEQGWKLKSLQPVDQFPHTRHLEVIGELTQN